VILSRTVHRPERAGKRRTALRGYGASTAALFLQAHGVEERRVAIAWDAIALHTSPGIANRKATEVAMCQAGIATDIIGR
jgi:hypothetical protein